MKRNVINNLIILLVVAICSISCSKESTTPSNQTKTYKINISAQKASSKVVSVEGNVATATFNTAEDVFVYNTTTEEMDEGILHPTSNTAHTSFGGTLAGTYNVNDNLKILYNTTSEGIADYTKQNGEIETVLDAGVGSVQITDITGDRITTGNACRCPR